MKPKYSFPSIQFALLAIPFLLLGPAVHSQDPGENENASEIAEAEKAGPGAARRAKEAAERKNAGAEQAKAAAEQAKEAAADRGEAAAERAKKAAEKEKADAEQVKEAADRAEAAAERDEAAAERAKKAAEKEKADAEQAKETAERDEAAAERAKKAAEQQKADAEQAKEAAQRGEAAAERAKKAAEQEKAVAEQAKEAAQRGEAAAERAKKVAEREKAVAEEEERAAAAKLAAEKASVEGTGTAESEAVETPEMRARGQGRGEATTGVRERPERRPAVAPREGGERRERPSTAAPAVEPTAPQADEDRPSATSPQIPSRPLRPREEMNLRGKEADRTKEERTEIAPEDAAEQETVEIPASEPERVAEKAVAEVTREVQREVDQRKTRIEGREQAQAVIDEILGAESRISRAEIAREERFRPRIERQRRGEERRREVSPEERREATTYYQQRLQGRQVDGQREEYFRRSERRGDRRDRRVQEGGVEIVDLRYLNEGRRYVYYDSRAAIPAILMAAQAMNYVRFQPAIEVGPMFYERQDLSGTYRGPLPPENYRSENSWVVSYPVDENSMISSEDIVFLQGSTQFSDPYSYEIVGALADAMREMPEAERFVIEGHASAEGSYESNMILSQQRAEYIVREIVRRGVSPYRLLPVGYGESEARHPADAAESLRSQDRRVVVFRMEPEPIARR